MTITIEKKIRFEYGRTSRTAYFDYATHVSLVYETTGALGSDQIRGIEPERRIDYNGHIIYGFVEKFGFWNRVVRRVIIIRNPIENAI